MSSWILPTVAFILGLIILSGGAEALIRGAIRIARLWKISPIVIGLTIVAFGTSAPEMGVALSAALSGQPDITMGNILGSNIANTGLILGLGALLTPLPVRLRMLRIEIPLLIVVSMALWAFATMGHLGRLAGMILLITFTTYCVTLYRHSREKPYTLQVEFEKSLSDKGSFWFDLVLVIAGLAGLVIGSKSLVWGAENIAVYLGIPELIVGLILTAIGTSLPELATTVAAARRGQTDLILGNVIGSNLANLCAVLGVTACITPIDINPDLLYRDFPVMVAFSLVLLPVMRIGMKVTRWEGAALLLSYSVYVIFLAVF
ncbi:MAG: sodium:calcium antiporter [Thermodesulfobacteriota bacterium]|nr:MAG: sodium:calcium antiporter [Thermodesulfobacteriota bacterium]